MFLPSPWPSGRPAPLLRSFSAAWLREVPSRRASWRMASASSSSKPSDCELLHTGHLSDSSSEAFRVTISVSCREVKNIAANGERVAVQLEPAQPG